MTIGIEKIFFGYILQNKKYFPIVENYYFKNNEIQFVYKIIREYMLKGGSIELPSPKQILEMVIIEDKDGLITKDILKSMLTVNLEEYDELHFIIPRFNAWILGNKIKAGTVDIIDETRNLEGIVDLNGTMETVNKIKAIVDNMSNTNFLGEEDDLGSDFDNVECHVQDTSRFKIKSGIGTLDHMLGGGWDIGTLNVLMGETNSGKCFFGDSKLEIKNKKTGEIVKITGEKMFSKISQRHNNF